MILGAKAPNYDTYGLFRAKYMPLEHITVPNIRILQDYHPTFMLILIHYAPKSNISSNIRSVLKLPFAVISPVINALWNVILP